jgi:hypothetical protein
MENFAMKFIVVLDVGKIAIAIVLLVELFK